MPQNTAAAPRTLAQIAERLGLSREGDDVPITRPALVAEAGPGTLCLAANTEYARRAAEAGAAAVLLPPGVETPLPCLRAEKPRVAFARLLALYDNRPFPPPGVHPSAVVHPNAVVHPTAALGPHVVVEAGARVGARAVLAANVFIGADAVVGDDAVLGPGVVIYHNCSLGNRVRVQAGTVIASDGFGYEWDGTEHVRVPHIGAVIVEDDAELGANCAIDRAKTGATRIGHGAKLDNLVQVGHGTHVGAFCLLAAQAGMGGSTVLEPGVVLAGQVGVADNITVGAGAIISAKSGVTGSLPGGQTYMGMPAREAREMRRIYAVQPRLPEVPARLRALERRQQSDAAGEDAAPPE